MGSDNTLRKKNIKIMNNIFAATGIGAMIVFIATVLVAGIAASVLIQTSMELETQAMTTGQQTLGEVATGLAVTDIDGYDLGNGGLVYWLVIGVRARAGSQDVDLGQCVIELSDSSTKNFLTYNPGNFTTKTSINGNVFTDTFYPNSTANSSTTFGIIVLEDGDGSCTVVTPVINKGDHVMLTVNASATFGGLSTRKDIFGMVIPEIGSPGIISFTTPAAYSELVVQLQ
ncbi:MAG: flagellin [Euryarchaeota archaeon]|nr:flagellin [Euryarchaeota archaeon]